ncbi:MAG: NYN domain-containing protein [Spirochaetes bacterium]|nr:NYN domain-containing protein [Spirochaetota bacterium]
MCNRSVIYIDGFNLYYGAVKNTPWKWLNIEKYFSLLRQDDDIKTIKYFTAKIEGSHKSNQEAYLKALYTLDTVQIIYRLFKYKPVKCLVRDCTYPKCRIFNIPEEKRTDVNIAVHMITDAMQNRCDRFVVISGDSDLVPAVRAVKLINNDSKVIVYIPANNKVRGAAVELRKASDRHRTLPNNLLSKAQFPKIIIDSNGTVIEKPSSWGECITCFVNLAVKNIFLHLHPLISV